MVLDVVIAGDDQHQHRWAGGTCGNVMTILSALGWMSYPVVTLNGDRAGRHVREDLTRWGVQLDFAESHLAPDTPIIVQTTTRLRDGVPRPRYRWTCPNCGAALPRYRPVRLSLAHRAAREMKHPRVVFLDRVSRAAIDLARAGADNEALVVFEPSNLGERSLFDEALTLANIVKYAADRFAALEVPLRDISRPVVEIQSAGNDGLRYRSNLDGCSGEWTHMPAFEVPTIRDTSGAGDWCTATLLDRIGRHGEPGLARTLGADLEGALRRGQAYAAWNCQYEGPRGVQYELPLDAMTRAVECLLAGASTEGPLCDDAHPKAIVATPLCPACG